MRTDGHLGLNLLLASPIVLMYPGDLTDRSLWTFLIFFLGMCAWPDIDLKFELKHRSYTHTLLGCFIFGLISVFIVIFARMEYIFQGFAGGFLGSLGHILGDLMTYMKFKPLWPISNREVALGLFRSNNRKVNRLFGKIGAIVFGLTLVYKGLNPVSSP